MKKLVLLFALIGAAACGITKPIPPINHTTIIRYVDSTRWHDTTIVTYLQKERYNEISNPFDTLKLETNYAEAQAYLDTTFKVLRGNIANKTDVPVETVIKWKEKIIIKDNVITEEVPVPYETIKEIHKIPKSYWWFMGFSILVVVYFIIKIVIKLKFGIKI